MLKTHSVATNRGAGPPTAWLRSASVGALLAVVCLLGLILGLQPGSPSPSIALLAPALLVVGLNLRAWRLHPEHPLRPSWSLLAIGMVIMLAGELVRLISDGTGDPGNVIVVALNLVAYPFYLVSSGVRVQQAAGRSLSLAAMLDALTCALVAGAFGAIVFVPLAQSVPPPVLIGAVVPPLLSLGLLVVALYLAFATTRERQPATCWLLVAAAAATTVGNWLVAVDRLSDPVSWAIPAAMGLFVCGFLALALLPCLDLRQAETRPDPIGHLQSVLVQTVPLVFIGLLAVRVIGEQSGSEGMFLQRALALGTLLVVARQWLMLRLNARLLARQQNSNDALARAHERAAHEARTDPLTGLPNQRLLKEYLATAIAAHRRAGLPLTVLFIDLDFFKAINDDYGHVAGDMALIEIGHRLRATLREGDVVARYGGEEFVLLLPHTGQADGLATAERVRQAIAEVPVTLPGDHRVPITVSIGLAVGPGNAATAEGLLLAADSALYAAKQAGRDRVRFVADSFVGVPAD